MKTYVVEGAPARFGSGVKLGLTAAQFATRSHLFEKGLVPDEKGNVVGTTLGPVEFKIGESLLIDGDEPKTVEDPLSGEKLSKPARRRKAVAAAKAKAKKAPRK